MTREPIVQVLEVACSQVSFEPTAAGCRVRFEHGGWTAQNTVQRPKFCDWPLLLGRFAALADA